MSYDSWFAKEEQEEPRPRCAECGKVCKAESAVPIYQIPEKATWVIPDRLKGIYHDADCALDAYLRGYAFWRSTQPKYK